MIVLVMGVAGAGKSTVGARVAEDFGVAFLEGDVLHPADNIASMRAGRPLTDAMRRPWLEAIATAAGRARPQTVVIACSALKRDYRDLLRNRLGPVRIVWLEGDRDVIAGRMAARRGHFMPASLLDSQFADLEPPAPDEKALLVPVTLAPEAQAKAIVGWLKARPGGATFPSETRSDTPPRKG